MSTRGEIGVIDNNKVKVIYNHHDSYLSGVGKDLLIEWNSKEKALKVIKGDYNNDDLKYEFDSVEEWINHLDGSDREYAYLFKDDKWYYTESNDNWNFKNDWKLLTELEIKILNNVEKCWKCGIILTPSNMSSSVYMSNPPKYTCINCENKKVKETIIDLIEIKAL